MAIKKDMNKLTTIPLFIFCLLLLFSGCGKMNDKLLGDEGKWANGQGELSEQITSPNGLNHRGSPPPYHYFEDYIEVIDKTEYDMPTSHWFMHDDEGRFGMDYLLERWNPVQNM